MIVAIGLALMAGCKDKTNQPTAGESADSGAVSGDPSAETATAAIADDESTADASASTDSAKDGETFVVKGIAFTVPDGWIQETATGTMRVAQFVLPGDGGPATLVVTYFGSDGAGPRDDNIKRWIGLVAVADEDTADADAQSKTVSHNGLEHTVVVATGTVSAPSMRPGAPAVAPKLNHTLYGVILEGGPEGPLYLKATGPATTIAAQTPAIEAFIKSARKVE
ncbi:MAG: hypothetical protein IID37_01715 [Planctomycetes bacterium]|nr:hypothetical protein [Planctomycetota bacterium]